MQKLRYPVNYVGIVTYYSSSHQALDLAWHYKEAEEIYACADGEVTNIWEDKDFGGGLSLRIEYDNGYASEFKHLSKTLVNIGDKVEQAQQVAVMGCSGWACAGTHLHYNCYKNGSRVNPMEHTYVYPGQEVCADDINKVLYYTPETKTKEIEELKKAIETYQQQANELNTTIEEQNNKIALQEKQIEDLIHALTFSKYECKIEEPNYYKIQMYKDETLCIKFAKDTTFEMQLDKDDVVKVK